MQTETIVPVVAGCSVDSVADSVVGSVVGSAVGPVVHSVVHSVVVALQVWLPSVSMQSSAAAH